MGLSLAQAARRVLTCPEPREKVRLAKACAEAWDAGMINEIGARGAPESPARPAKPRLLRPREMPRRRAGKSRAERIALFHALAHIEFNAIDLAFDLIARFADPALPPAFYSDWTRIGAEEALHFELLAHRLEAMGSAYGALPAHGGLWEAAAATSDDLTARLAVVPLVLEARGLDVTPGMIARLESYDDREGAGILKRILADEIGHVANGRHWFEWLVRRRGADAPAAWAELVRLRFKGEIKPPFNAEARAAAGVGPAWLDRAVPPSGGEPAR